MSEKAKNPIEQIGIAVIMKTCHKKPIEAFYIEHGVVENKPGSIARVE